MLFPSSRDGKRCIFCPFFAGILCRFRPPSSPTLFSVHQSPAPVIFPKSILETITQPFSYTASSISDWVENTLDTLVNAEKYKKENTELKEKLNEMIKAANVIFSQAGLFFQLQGDPMTCGGPDDWNLTMYNIVELYIGDDDLSYDEYTPQFMRLVKPNLPCDGDGIDMFFVGTLKFAEGKGAEHFALCTSGKIVIPQGFGDQTLAHELGHYMLDIEEVDQENLILMDDGDISKIEKWCNDFAYYFIMGQVAQELNVQVNHVGADTDYHYEYVAELSKHAHISRFAIYTRLYVDGKMTFTSYDTVRNGLAEEYRQRQERERAERENKKSFGRTPKPIISPLYLRTMQYAYFKGIVSETVFCTQLHIKPDQFEKMIWQ